MKGRGVCVLLLILMPCPKQIDTTSFCFQNKSIALLAAEFQEELSAFGNLVKTLDLRVCDMEK